VVFVEKPGCLLVGVDGRVEAGHGRIADVSQVEMVAESANFTKESQAVFACDSSRRVLARRHVYRPRGVVLPRSVRPPAMHINRTHWRKAEEKERKRESERERETAAEKRHCW
jgi:hypothetical protein